MNVWLITANRREKIPWWRIHLYLAGTVVLFGFGAAMGVLYTRAKLIDSKLKDRTDYITTIAKLEQDNKEMKVELTTLAQDYLASITRNGELK